MFELFQISDNNIKKLRIDIKEYIKFYSKYNKLLSITKDEKMMIDYNLKIYKTVLENIRKNSNIDPLPLNILN